MPSGSSPMASRWLDLNIDRRGAAYAKATKPSELAWEGIGGTIRIVATWTCEGESTSYTPKSGVLVVKHVVLSAVLDELVAACLNVSRSESSSLSVVVHGTPLELDIKVDREEAEIRILEYLDYSDRPRTLGVLIVTRNELFLTVAETVEKFLKRLISANPSVGQTSAVRLLKEQSERFREQVK